MTPEITWWILFNLFVLGMLALGACSTEQMVGTGAGGVAGYALGGKTGAAAGAVGGGILGTILD